MGPSVTTERLPDSTMIGTSLKFLLDVGYKWGIFALLSTTFFTFLMWSLVSLYHSHMETNRYIRDELVEAIRSTSTAIERGVETDRQVITALKENDEEREALKDVLISCMEAIEESNERQKNE